MSASSNSCPLDEWMSGRIWNETVDRFLSFLSSKDMKDVKSCVCQYKEERLGFLLHHVCTFTASYQNSSCQAESYLSQLYCKKESQTFFIIWTVNKSVSVLYLAHEMSHFNFESKQSAKSCPVLSAKRGWAWLLQTPANESRNAEHLRVFVVLSSQKHSCIIASFTFPFVAHDSMCVRLCVHVVYMHAFGACSMWVILCVCVCVSHNSATVGQHVQPSRSLSGHSVRRHTGLIHFALALTLNPPSIFLQTWSTFKLHFCPHTLLHQCFLLQHKLNSSLRLLFWLEASPLQPCWPHQIARRHAVLGSVAS